MKRLKPAANDLLLPPEAAVIFAGSRFTRRGRDAASPR
jgi:hypothetical protein